MKPFGKIAVASTFSPRFLPMLAEAKAVAAVLGVPFEIVHAGEETAEDRERFARAFAEMEITGPIHWRQAGQPSDAIIRAVADAGVDLLLAGAMERDSHGRYFLGKVARALIQEAPCALLLFANPSLQPPPLRTLAVVVDYTPASRHALKTTLELAARVGVESVHVMRVFTVFAQMLAEPEGLLKGRDSHHALAAEEARLDAFVEEFEISAIPIITRCIEGTTGFAASDYVQSIEADLLVIATERTTGPARFPARMEWLENVIPSNLLVVRPPA